MVDARPNEQKADELGIECPECGCRHFSVLRTRPASKNRLMRRRECRHCGRRITTYEKIGGSK